MFKQYKVLIQAIDKNNSFVLLKEFIPYYLAEPPKNTFEEIMYFITVLTPLYKKNGLRPVDVVGVLNMDDTVVWSDPLPDYIKEDVKVTI